jgi:hypothetical protein
MLLTAALAVPVFAQYRDDDYNRRGSRGRGGYGYGDRNGSWQRFGGSPVRDAIRDLQAIGSRARVDSHERDHFRDGVRHLMRFEDRLRSGRWDGDALDDAIEDIQDLSQADQLNPRDRSILRQDLHALRNFRANRGNGYGYRDDRARWPY